MDERLDSGVPSGALSPFATAGTAYLDQVSTGLFSKLAERICWQRSTLAASQIGYGSTYVSDGKPLGLLSL